MRRPTSVSRSWIALGALVLVGLGAAAFVLLHGSGTRSPGSATASSARPVSGQYEYVFPNGEIDVYAVGSDRLVQRIPLPQLTAVRDVAVHPATSMLYVSYGGQGGASGNGSMLAYNLVRGSVVWQRHYASGVDSIAITPNGRTIYLPAGEQSSSPLWQIVDAADGTVTGSIKAGAGAHNTIVAPDGRYVYLAGVDHPYLAVASTATNKLVREIGPSGPAVARSSSTDDRPSCSRPPRTCSAFR